MKTLAEQLGIQCNIDNVCKIKFLSKFLRQFHLTGNIRGKFFNIYTLRSTCKPNVNVRTVVSTELHTENNFSMIIRPKKLKNFLKIFGKTFTPTHDAILDEYLLVECSDQNIIKEIFVFEEIRDQFAKVWSSSYNNGMLIVNTAGVTYFEPHGFFNQKKRTRIASAVHLVCDIVDIIQSISYKI